jgi:ABC-2 type transport system permease protein
MRPGWIGNAAAVARRECVRARADRTVLMLALVVPLVASLALAATFVRRVPGNLPVAVCDQDRSALSRRIVRMIDATRAIAVTARVDDPLAGERLVRRGEAYAVVLLPEGLERDVLRGDAPRVIAWVNQQWLLPGSLVARDLRAAVATASAGADLRARRARGEMPAAALAHIEPVRVARHALFSPTLDYLDFLLPALLATVLQMCVFMLTVHAVGSELKHGTAKAWTDAAGGGLGAALAGKLLPCTAWFTLLGLGHLAWMVAGFALPVRGSAALLVLSVPAFVLATQAVALAVVAWTANLRLATSLGAFYTGTAFAFSGVTFPAPSMPWLGRAWSALLPLTHELRLLFEQTLRGAPAVASCDSLLTLAAFVVIAGALAWARLPEVVREPRFWGRT